MWGALETLAADSGGATQASLGSAGGGRNRKAADAARDLLSLPCVGAVPTELVMCYERCKVAPRAGEGAAVAAEEVRRREVADTIYLIVFIIGHFRQGCQACGQLKANVWDVSRKTGAFPSTSRPRKSCLAVRIDTPAEGS